MNKNIRKSKLNRPENLTKAKLTREENLVLRKQSHENKISKGSDKSVRNRCCLVRPKQQDFGHRTSSELLHRYGISSPIKKRVSLLSEKYGFDPVKPESTLASTEFKSIMFGRSKSDISSPNKEDFGGDAPKFVETSDGTQWQNIESVSDLEKFIQDECKGVKRPPIMPKNIHIDEVPKVKIMAEKFSKFQRDNVELRRLDEKVVCVEYDIFNKESTSDVRKPVQAMRAFFSIKPIYEHDGTESLPLIALPSKIKNQFNIVEEDLNNLTQNGIEIIDENIEENKSYLEDLKRILKRAQYERAKKDRSSLDLKSLYEMAKRELYLDNNVAVANFLSIKELQEVKDLILQQCASSVHGISRKMLKADSKLGSGILSGCMLAELFGDSAKKTCL